MKNVPKNYSLLILFLLTVFWGCKSDIDPEPNITEQRTDTKKTYQNLVVGYSQLGAESEWRTGNTASIPQSKKPPKVWAWS